MSQPKNKTSRTRTNYRAVLSRPPRTEAEARAQAEALAKRDAKLIRTLAKI